MRTTRPGIPASRPRHSAGQRDTKPDRRADCHLRLRLAPSRQRRVSRGLDGCAANDLGLISETRDPPGRLWRRQTPRQNPGGHYTTHSYDVLDRLTARVDANLESHWVFDSAVKGIGQLAEAYTGPAGNKDYRRLHSYDSLGRPSLTQRVIDSTVYSSTATCHLQDTCERPLLDNSHGGKRCDHRKCEADRVHEDGRASVPRHIPTGEVVKHNIYEQGKQCHVRDP